MMADEILDRVRTNEWGAAKYVIKSMWFANMPAYLGFTLLMILIIPPFRPYFWGLLALQIIMFFTKKKWGVGFKDIPRFMRNQINNNKLHGHRYHRKRSSTRFWSAAVVVVTIGVGVPAKEASASFELVVPPANANDATPNIESELTQIPMIERGIIHQGFGHDVPLDRVMGQLVPNSWIVNFRDPELKGLPVSWRSQDLDIIEIFEDLSERYELTFRYSNRSGVIHVEWREQSCRTGQDRAGVYNLIC